MDALLLEYSQILERIHQDVLPLGVREYLSVQRVVHAARASGWSEQRLGDSLASALATNPRQWQSIRQFFTQFSRRQKAPAPRPPAPADPIPVLAPTAVDNTAKFSPPTPDLLQPVRRQDSVPIVIGKPPPASFPPGVAAENSGIALPGPHGNEDRSGQETLRLTEEEILLAISFPFESSEPSSPALAPGPTWLPPSPQLQAPQDDAVLDRLRSNGLEARQKLEWEALRTGQEVSPRYRVVIKPPLSVGVVEDCATWLGRMYESTQGTNLDVTRTVAQTVAAGGQPQLFFQLSRRARTLLVLYEESDTQPYLPSFLALIERWQCLGVPIALLAFEFHPSTLYHPGTHQWVDLPALASLYEHAAVLIFASRLRVYGLDNELSWPRFLRNFPLRAWLDPDPRPLEEREPDERSEIKRLEELLLRFPLTASGLRGLARYYVEQDPALAAPSPPLSMSLAQPETRKWIDHWLGLAAQVPDATYEQMEGIRQHLLSEALPDGSLIHLACERLRELQGDRYAPGSMTVELSKEDRQRLLLDLQEEAPRLWRQGFELLLHWLEAALGADAENTKTLLYHETNQRRQWCRAALCPKDADRLLGSLLGTPSHDFAYESLVLVRALVAAAPRSDQPTDPQALQEQYHQHINAGDMAFELRQYYEAERKYLLAQAIAIQLNGLNQEKHASLLQTCKDKLECVKDERQSYDDYERFNKKLSKHDDLARRYQAGFVQTEAICGYRELGRLALRFNDAGAAQKCFDRARAIVERILGSGDAYRRRSVEPFQQNWIDLTMNYFVDGLDFLKHHKRDAANSSIAYGYNMFNLLVTTPWPPNELTDQMNAWKQLLDAASGRDDLRLSELLTDMLIALQGK